MKLKELLDVMVTSDQIGVTFMNKSNEPESLKSSAGMMRYSEELMDLEVTVMFYSKADECIHVCLQDS